MNSKFTLLTSFILVVCLSWQTAAHAQKFVNPLPIPYLMPGTNFNIDITSTNHNFDPNGFVDSVDLNVPIPTYCYNEVGNTGMTYLGPTLIFEKGKDMTFNIANKLDTMVNTTVHWHGLNIPAEEDGGPHQVINHNMTWSPSFPVIDPVQTVWYHSHLMNQTTDQVIRGMAGMIYVQDPTNDPLYTKLPRDYGVNDLPIIIQEKGFNFDTLSDGTIKAKSLIAGEKPGNGVYTLVNGVVGPVMRVPGQFVRLRILNGSPRKMFHIGISDELVNPTNFATIYMIATGGGYTDEVKFVNTQIMSIGDRREFVVDFGAYNNGDTVYMSNLYKSLPSDARYGNTPGNAIMAFVVDNSIQPTNPSTIIPIALDGNYGLAPGPVFKTRNKKLYGHPTGNGQGGVWTIDSIPMNMAVINDTVLVNTKERWVIDNTTSHAHPFHIHKVQFQVTKYEGTLGFPDGNGGITDQTGVWEWPNLPEELLGYKDVQLIRKNSIMTFEARFDSFPSPFDMQNLNTQGFMYHCHILTHEDTSMMHQFVSG
ncbi:MAG: multicopper oxidase domain-containing protein [Saprospiraceae bacterium]